MISPKSFQTFIYEAINRTQQLDDLRKASANATLTGPSKEAQELMSDRTKAILGQNKLKAGIEAQQNVEKMKSEIDAPKPPSTSSPTPTATPTRSPAPASSPTPTATPTRSPAPAPSPSPVPIPVVPFKPNGSSTSSPTLTPQQLNDYNRALSNLNNPLARRIIQSRFKQLTPEQQQQFRDHAKQQGHDWGDLF